MMYRPTLFGLLGALALVMLASCCPEDPFSPTNTDCDSTELHNNYAHLRVIHALPTDGPVDLYVDGERLFPAPVGYVDFGGVNAAAYYPVDPGPAALRFVGSNGEVVTNAVLQQGKFYTVYYFGTRSTQQALVTTDEPFPVPGNFEVKIQAVHLAADAPTNLNVTILDDQGKEVTSFGDVSFGATSGYVSFPAQFNSGLLITDPATDDTLFNVPSPYVFLPGASTYTLAITGKIYPQGNEPMLSILGFRESTKNTNVPCAFGSPPIRLEFSAVRLVHLVSSGDTQLDLAFLDSANSIAEVEYFRRNLPGQEKVDDVPPLELLSGPAEYFLMNPNGPVSNPGRYPYRVEINQGLPFYLGQDPLTPIGGLAEEFHVAANKRYSIIAYGPFEPGEASTTALVDDIPAPSSDATARIRFFHGSTANADKSLRIRIGSGQSPLMSYGQAPDGTEDSFEISAGPLSVEVVDESGTVVGTFTPAQALEGGRTYTIFFFDGRNGDAPTLIPLTDRLYL